MRKILTTDDFARAFERERARADRTEGGFSVVVFERVRSINGGYPLETFTGAVQSRIRLSDEIGWVDSGRLGLILPDTTCQGAHRLAELCCNGSSPQAGFFTYSVFVYPNNWLATDEKGDSFPEKYGPTSTQPAEQAPSHKGLLQTLRPVMPRRLPFWKRTMDITLAIAGMMIILPILLAIALYIKIVSRGPVMFRQKRIGYLGEEFTCWKFRTMYLNANVSVHQVHMSELINKGRPMTKLDDHDPRIIPLGNFMRKTGLDELPQLLNVIRGEMSLIGPRPCIPYEACQYQRWQHQRFDTVPGLTGLWQVSGKNKTTFNEMMRYDITYTKRRSLWFDIKILFKTLPAIFKEITN